MKWLNYKFAILVLIVGILLPNTRTDAKLYAPTMTEQAALAVIKDAELDLWINKLVQAESNGREDVVILDVNGKYSHGCLQFQQGTFNSYAQRYGLEGNIMDCDLQKTLARKMIEENINNWKHWFNSTKKIGLPPV